jgi:16S rRNA (cytidine1402-2'-O)-methyltransferase
MAGSLYVVSTPIGNLDDMSIRAVSTLKSVGLIAAEDTRRTGALLRHFGIATPTTSFHEHNEHQKLPQLLRRLDDGVDIAVVSDAGTPTVSDPGQKLIAEAVRRGIRVVPVPGASAVLAALAASGYDGRQFVFAGFAPAKSSDRKRWLQEFMAESRPVVLFEAPHRIKATLELIGDMFGKRPIMVGRELTKLHETVVHASADEAHKLDIPEKGEFTLVLGPISLPTSQTQIVNDDEITTYFGYITNSGGVSRREAVVSTARKFGLSTNDVYRRLERSKDTGCLDR